MRQNPGWINSNCNILSVRFVDKPIYNLEDQQLHYIMYNVIAGIF